MLLHNACGFERRVVASTKLFPWKLLLLVKSPPEVCCAIRQQIATEILESNDKLLEINARKIKKRFAGELQQASQQGTLGYRLYWLLKGVTIVAKSDVRESERLNKMVTLMDDRAPNSSIELKKL